MPEVSSEALSPEKTSEKIAALTYEEGVTPHEADKDGLEEHKYIDIPAPGDVVVSFDKINEIVSGKQATQYCRAVYETGFSPVCSTL